MRQVAGVRARAGADSLRRYFAADPYARFYNLDGLTDVFLTCDIDWAPEFAIETVLRAVEAHGHKLTIFATHRSELLLGARASDWLEVGLHPDFTRQDGKRRFEERIQALKQVYPAAVGMRSHRDFFGNNIGDIARENGLRYDASTFLWNQPFCTAHVDYNGMTRFSYCWEDGIHLDMGFGLDVSRVTLDAPGLKILNVHPILMYLNSSSEAHRRAVTSRYADLTTAPEAEISADVNRGRGIADVWRDLLRYLAEHGVRTHLLGEAANANGKG
jgi:hypothetical protein